MALAVVDEAQAERREDERRGAALLVAPFDLRVAHLDIVLAEEPVAEAALAGSRDQLDAGDVQRALRVAPHGEPRLVDAQRMEPEPRVRERAP